MISANQPQRSDCHNAPVVHCEGTAWDVDPASIKAGATFYYGCSECHKACAVVADDTLDITKYCDVCGGSDTDCPEYRKQAHYVMAADLPKPAKSNQSVEDWNKGDANSNVGDRTEELDDIVYELWAIIKKDSLASSQIGSPSSHTRVALLAFMERRDRETSIAQTKRIRNLVQQQGRGSWQRIIEGELAALTNAGEPK